MSRAEEIAARLSELAELLKNPQLDDAESQRLAEEASKLITEAGSEVDRQLADAAAAKPPPEDG